MGTTHWGEIQPTLQIISFVIRQLLYRMRRWPLRPYKRICRWSGMIHDFFAWLMWRESLSTIEYAPGRVFAPTILLPLLHIMRWLRMLDCPR